MKSFLCCLALVLVSGTARSQEWDRQFPAPPPVFEAVFALDPLDSASLRFGLTEDTVKEVMQRAVEGTGWELRTGADLAIILRVSALTPRKENQSTFRIDVKAGSQSVPIHMGTGGLSGSNIVDVTPGDLTKLLSEINQLTTKTSWRLRAVRSC